MYDSMSFKQRKIWLKPIGLNVIQLNHNIIIHDLTQATLHWKETLIAEVDHAFDLLLVPWLQKKWTNQSKMAQPKVKIVCKEIDKVRQNRFNVNVI